MKLAMTNPTWATLIQFGKIALCESFTSLDRPLPLTERRVVKVEMEEMKGNMFMMRIRVRETVDFI
jgi:hypothetical protein